MDNHQSHSSDAAAYTAEEKAWLKKNFDGEFKFLQMYGLSISKPDDREEGRRIARALMEKDSGT